LIFLHKTQERKSKVKGWMDYLAQQDFYVRFIQLEGRDESASCKGFDGAIHGRGGLDKVCEEGIKESI
jgi:hypothetical protein